jgi:hypothetical protein
VLGRADYPVPLNGNDTSITPRDLDAQWVRFSGMIQHTEIVDGHSVWTIGNSYQTVHVFMPDTKAPELSGKQVSFTGAWKQKGLADRIIAELFVPDVSLVDVSTSTEAVPAVDQELDRLNGLDNERVRIKGIVSLKISNSQFLVWSNGSVAEVLTTAPVDLAVNDEAEVTGFVTRRNNRVLLDNATVIRLGENKTPIPTRSISDEKSRVYGQVVQLVGTLIDDNIESEFQTLIVKSRWGVCTATLDLRLSNKSIELSPPGSRIQLTGVYLEQGPIKPTFALALRGTADVKVLDVPEPVEPSSSSLMVIGVCATILLVLAGAIVSSRYHSNRTHALAGDINDLKGQLSEMAHAQRVNALESVVTGISHELAQPLAALSNYAEACKRSVLNGDHALVGEFLDTIIRLTRRISDTIRRLQKMSKKHEPTRSLSDINWLVSEATAVCAATGHDNARYILFEPDDSVPAVNVDDVQIIQVVTNLITNALEATEGEANPFVVVKATCVDSTHVEISVCDNGVGLPNCLPNGGSVDVFESNFSTKPSGMGIGLAISKAIVEIHGGTLTAESNPDKGSTFRVRLPVAGPTVGLVNSEDPTHSERPRIRFGGTTASGL